MVRLRRKNYTDTFHLLVTVLFWFMINTCVYNFLVFNLIYGFSLPLEDVPLYYLEWMLTNLYNICRRA